ncbi:MAG: hypothetical protein M1820_008162 [Bogoriella megaspora]|nr:MAG: hypothetical protein M1820_008162 [Bogoriella megaspora]
MAPRTPRRERTQNETAELAKLIDRYKVLYLNPAPSNRTQRWAEPYKHLLDQIDEIQAVRFDAYPHANHHDVEGAYRRKLLVRKIQANAVRCRRERRNEAGWINNVGSLVFDRINGIEFVCQNCKKQTSKPDFVGLPKDTRAAQELLRMHADRSVCKCTAMERANVMSVDTVLPSIFSNKSDERVLHRDSDLQGVSLDQKYKRPDLVVGLSMTASFRDCLGPLATEKYSPFTDGYTCFPFLVVEAKSEKGGPGFEAIERQSALTIRSCLKLQVDLEKDSGNELLHPLVWFIGFQGDDWRLYCAVPKADETRIIDCWHGYLPNEDQALQLLLIMDWICYWARDVYRVAVLKCMRAVTPLARCETPAETEFSAYNEGTGDALYSRQTSLALRSSIPPPIPRRASPQHAESSRAGQMRKPSSEFAGKASMRNPSPSFEDDQGSVADRANVIAVVDANNRLVEWKHLSIPEEETELMEVIRGAIGATSFRETAWELYGVLTDDAHTLRLSRRVVRDLWEGRSGNSDCEFEDEEPIATLVLCRNRFDEATWQVVQSFTAITCSQEAAQQLAIAAQASENATLPLSYWKAHDCDCLMLAANAIQSVNGRQSAFWASFQDTFYLVSDGLDRRGVHSRWERYDRGQPKQLLFERIETLADNIGARAPELARFANGDSQQSPNIDHLYKPLIDDDLLGMLVKRLNRWPPGSPLWCFVTFEPTRPGNIERQIARTRGRRAIWADEGLRAIKDLTDEDKRSLNEAISQIRILIE